MAKEKLFYISTGNMKMNVGFLIWNLPTTKTCIGRTPMCEKICYAKKAERFYKNAILSRERNLDFVQNNPDWIDLLCAEIEKLSRKEKFKGFFRLHESGDFFSQGYLDGWKEISRRFPSIKFLAFTKSFTLDFRNLPKNFQVVFSVMPDTVGPIPKGRRAYAGDCDYNTEQTVECSGLCDGCGICWELNRFGLDVHFPLH